MCVYVYVSLYVCMFVCLCMCVFVRVCLCMCVYVSMCGVPGHACIRRPAGTVDFSWATGFNKPGGVALDPSSGALFVVNGGTRPVCRVPAGGGADDPRAH